jgi:hypothetical protein
MPIASTPAPASASSVYPMADPEQAALTELDADLKKTADRESGAALTRAELVAELRKGLIHELIRQLVLRHMPIVKVMELIESVRNAGAGPTQTLGAPSSGFDPAAIAKELWRLEDFLVMAAEKEPPTTPNPGLSTRAPRAQSPPSPP